MQIAMHIFRNVTTTFKLVCRIGGCISGGVDLGKNRCMCRILLMKTSGFFAFQN